MVTELCVDSEQCEGCGECVVHCPRKAIHIEGGVAIIDAELCDACEECIETCPRGAIYAVTDADSSEALPVPALVGDERVSRAPITVPQVRSPTLGALVAFVGREVVPRAVDALLAAWDRRQTSVTPKQRAGKSGSSGKLAGKRASRKEPHRHRRGRDE